MINEKDSSGKIKDPNNMKGYLRIRMIDVLSTALNANDRNFLNLAFGQSDMVFSSIRTKEQIQRETHMERWDHIPFVQNKNGKFWPWEWDWGFVYGDINNAFTYLSYSSADMIIPGNTESAFRASINPAALMELTNNGNSENKLSDRSWGNRFLQSFTQFDGFAGTWQDLVNSCFTVDSDTFKSELGDSVDTIFRVHNTRELKALEYDLGIRHHKTSYDRTKTGIYDVSGKSWNEIGQSFVEFLAPGIGTLIWESIEGGVKGNFDWAEILADVVGNLIQDAVTRYGMAVGFAVGPGGLALSSLTTSFINDNMGIG